MSQYTVLAAMVAACVLLSGCGGSETTPEKEETNTTSGNDSKSETTPEKEEKDTKSGNGGGTSGGGSGGGSGDGGTGTGGGQGSGTFACTKLCEKLKTRINSATTHEEIDQINVDTFEARGKEEISEEELLYLQALWDERIRELSPGTPKDDPEIPEDEMPKDTESARIKALVASAIQNGLREHPKDLNPSDSFGVWLHNANTPNDPSDDHMTLRYRPPGEQAIGPPLSVDFDGTANYSGDVQGYAYHGNTAGEFSADINLEADFERYAITGTVSGFSGSGANPAWEDATLTLKGPEGDQVSTVTTDNTTGGSWIADSYGVVSNQPEGIIGHMTLPYSDGAAIGAFSAPKSQ